MWAKAQSMSENVVRHAAQVPPHDLSVDHDGRGGDRRKRASKHARSISMLDSGTKCRAGILACPTQEFLTTLMPAPRLARLRIPVLFPLFPRKTSASDR